MFSGCTVPPDSKETELGSSDQEASPSAGKNTGVVLVPCLCMEVHPYSYFQWCGYFRGSWVSIVTTDEFSLGFTIGGYLVFEIWTKWGRVTKKLLKNRLAEREFS